MITNVGVRMEWRWTSGGGGWKGATAGREKGNEWWWLNWTSSSKSGEGNCRMLHKKHRVGSQQQASRPQTRHLHFHDNGNTKGLKDSAWIGFLIMAMAHFWWASYQPIKNDYVRIQPISCYLYKKKKIPKKKVHFTSEVILVAIKIDSNLIYKSGIWSLIRY